MVKQRGWPSAVSVQVTGKVRVSFTRLVSADFPLLPLPVLGDKNVTLLLEEGDIFIRVFYLLLIKAPILPLLFS